MASLSNACRNSRDRVGVISSRQTASRTAEWISDHNNGGAARRNRASWLRAVDDPLAASATPVSTTNRSVATALVTDDAIPIGLPAAVVERGPCLGYCCAIRRRDRVDVFLTDEVLRSHPLCWEAPRPNPPPNSLGIPADSPSGLRYGQHSAMLQHPCGRAARTSTPMRPYVPSGAKVLWACPRIELLAEPAASLPSSCHA